MDVEGRTAEEEILTHPKYRPDIDGLRAIAVLSVLGFHAFPELVHGGFIGVDIFFVISGFLISTIIFKSLASREFSFLEFYSRRVRRIFPALVTVLVVAFVCGWFVLYPDEYRQLSKHIVGGAWFFSNFVLWRESGYFDNSADSKPLLHLWSLGIEEQFYIVFPLFAWLLWKGRLNLLTWVVLGGLVSFLLNLRDVSHDAVRTFYMPQTRIWELLEGCVLALLVMDTSGRVGRMEKAAERMLNRMFYREKADVMPAITLFNVKAWIGALLIVVGLWKITKEMHFPGKWALLPTVGAVLLIWAGPGAFLNRWVLSNRVLMWVGKISYPLYLWHWILLSYLYILAAEMPPVAVRAGALAVAVVLSWLTYRLIEMPLRFGGSGRRKTLLLMALMVSVSIVGFAGYKENGFRTLPFIRSEQKTSREMTLLAQAKTINQNISANMNLNPCFQLPPDKNFAFFEKPACLPAKPVHGKSPSLLLIGDSHSAALSLGLRPWAKEHGFTFYQISSGSCSLFSDDISDPECNAYRRRTFEAVKSIRPNLLLIDMYWAYFIEPVSPEPVYFKNLGHWPSPIAYLQDRMRYIASLGPEQVVVIGQIPTWKSDLPSVLVREFLSHGKPIPKRSFLKIDPRSLTMDQSMRSLPIHIFSIQDQLCNKMGCLVRVGPDLRTDLTVWDYGHLTTAGAKFVINHGLGETILKTLRAEGKSIDPKSKSALRQEHG